MALQKEEKAKKQSGVKEKKKEKKFRQIMM